MSETENRSPTRKKAKVQVKRGTNDTQPPLDNLNLTSTLALKPHANLVHTSHTIVQ